MFKKLLITVVLILLFSVAQNQTTEYIHVSREIDSLERDIRLCKEIIDHYELKDNHLADKVVWDMNRRMVSKQLRIKSLQNES